MSTHSAGLGAACICLERYATLGIFKIRRHDSSPPRRCIVVVGEALTGRGGSIKARLGRSPGPPGNLSVGGVGHIVAISGPNPRCGSSSFQNYVLRRCCGYT
jgi:hypothetical protein